MKHLRWSIINSKDSLYTIQIFQVETIKESPHVLFRKISEIYEDGASEIHKWPEVFRIYIGDNHISEVESGSFIYGIVKNTDFIENKHLPEQKFLFSESISSNQQTNYHLYLSFFIEGNENVSYPILMHFTQTKRDRNLVLADNMWNLQEVFYEITDSELPLKKILNKIQPVIMTLFKDYFRKTTTDLLPKEFQTVFHKAYQFRSSCQRELFIPFSVKENPV